MPLSHVANTVVNNAFQQLVGQIVDKFGKQVGSAPLSHISGLTATVHISYEDTEDGLRDKMQELGFKPK